MMKSFNEPEWYSYALAWSLGVSWPSLFLYSPAKCSIRVSIIMACLENTWKHFGNFSKMYFSEILKKGLDPSTWVILSNYLSTKLNNKTLPEEFLRLGVHSPRPWIVKIDKAGNLHCRLMAARCPTTTLHTAIRATPSVSQKNMIVSFLSYSIKNIDNIELGKFGSSQGYFRQRQKAPKIPGGIWLPDKPVMMTGIPLMGADDTYQISFTIFGKCSR